VHPNLLPASDRAVPVIAVTPLNWAERASALGLPAVTFAQTSGFEAKSGNHLLVPDAQGGVAGVLFGVEGIASPGHDPFLAGKLAVVLPNGIYRLDERFPEPDMAVLAFLLGLYRFTRYRRKVAVPQIRLVVPQLVDGEAVSQIAEAVWLGRDLINTPANDLGPAEIEQAVRTVGARFGAKVTAVIGDDLMVRNFPMIHAVGRASSRAPRLIDLEWGDPGRPKVTLIGKGVAFDTGGLNIKPDSAMAIMKKDMGGAATALAAAQMIMAAALPVRLRVLIPAVENSISGSAFRPGDVLPSRKGISVEIGNTDAEGRLILADALALADEEAPDLILQFATLTGAARVALGPDLPPFYTDDAGLAEALQRLGMAVNDPVWRLPLWQPYEKMLDSKIADINHISGGSFAGSITAALFLRKFVERAKSFAHFDIYGWTPQARPGRSEGGEPQVARLVLAYLKEHYRRR
jgi:leucyl aminopeptidase